MEDQGNQQKQDKKMREIKDCLIQLELFCTNKLLNTSPDQKYSEVNVSRQKVLREQYFLDTLGEVLKYSFSSADLESVRKLIF